MATSAAGAAGRGRGGFAGRAPGAVHGLAALPRGSGRRPPERARVRRPALGGRGAARVPRVPGRVVAGGAAARPLYGASGVVRAPTWLGRGSAQRPHGQLVTALGPGDGRAGLQPHYHDRLEPRTRVGDPRAGGRQPTLRGGVRAPGRRPRARAAGRRSGGASAAREFAGVDRRPSGHALAGPQEPAPGRGRAWQGFLGRRRGRDRRS